MAIQQSASCEPHQINSRSATDHERADWPTLKSGDDGGGGDGGGRCGGWPSGGWLGGLAGSGGEGASGGCSSDQSGQPS